MRIHLVTLVGGHLDVLPFMLEHYRQAGVDSFTITVQLQHPDDPVLDRVRRVTERCGCDVTATAVGDWQALQRRVWAQSMRMHADDWCILADQDELHVYPDRLADLLAYCDRHGYDYIRGAFVDRIRSDGGFGDVEADRPLWSQFGLGGLLTLPILGGDPRKVVAAKGRVPLSVGQHVAFGGSGCPPEEIFVQVHHFKWTAGLIERLTRRAALLKRAGVPHWVESDRFLRYVAQHDGRIDLTDARFLMSPCEPSYPHWPQVVAMAAATHGAMNREEL